MSQTLLRFGLWIVLIVLAGYVLRETFAEAPFAELLTEELLQNSGMLGVALVVGGFILRLLEPLWKTVAKRRCANCRQPVMHGELYCREHLRQVLAREDELQRRTRFR